MRPSAVALPAAHEDVEEVAVGADVLRLHLRVERVDERLRLAQDAFLVGVAVGQQQDARARDQRREIGDEAARHDDRRDDIAARERAARLRPRHVDELDAPAGLPHDAPEVERAIADLDDVRDGVLVHEGHARPGALAAEDAADQQREHERVEHEHDDQRARARQQQQVLAQQQPEPAHAALRVRSTKATNARSCPPASSTAPASRQNASCGPA